MRGGHREGSGRKPGSHNPMTMFYIRVSQELKEKLSKIEPEKIRAALDRIGDENERQNHDQHVSVVPNVPGSGERKKIH